MAPSPLERLSQQFSALGQYQPMIDEYESEIGGLKNDYAAQLALANTPSTVSQGDAFLSAINMLLPAILGASFAKNKQKGAAIGLGAGVLGSKGYLDVKKTEGDEARKTALLKSQQMRDELKEKIDFKNQLVKDRMGKQLGTEQMLYVQDQANSRSAGRTKAVEDVLGVMLNKGASTDTPGPAADPSQYYAQRFPELLQQGATSEVANEIIARELSGQEGDSTIPAPSAPSAPTAPSQAAAPGLGGQGRTLEEIAYYYGLDLNDPEQRAAMDVIMKHGKGAQDIAAGRLNIAQKQQDLEQGAGINLQLKQAQLKETLADLEQKKAVLARNPLQNAQQMLELEKLNVAIAQSKQELAKTTQTMEQSGEAHPLDMQGKQFDVAEKARREQMTGSGVRAANQYFANAGATAEQSAKAKALGSQYKFLFESLAELENLSERTGWQRKDSGVVTKANLLRDSIAQALRSIQGFGSDKESGNSAIALEEIKKSIPRIGGWLQLPGSAVNALTGDVFVTGVEQEIKNLKAILERQLYADMEGLGHVRAIPPEVKQQYDQMKRLKGGM